MGKVKVYFCLKVNVLCSWEIQQSRVKNKTLQRHRFTQISALEPKVNCLAPDPLTSVIQVHFQALSKSITWPSLTGGLLVIRPDMWCDLSPGLKWPGVVWFLTTWFWTNGNSVVTAHMHPTFVFYFVFRCPRHYRCSFLNLLVKQALWGFEFPDTWSSCLMFHWGAAEVKRGKEEHESKGGKAWCLQT